jgi:hypothetical protein
MRHLRRTVLAAIAVAICAAPVASAHSTHHDRGGAVVAPARGGGLSGGELLGAAWARGFAMPVGAVDPFRGGCVPLARNVLHPSIGDDGTATCTITQRTRLFVFFGSACSNVEPDPYRFDTEADQLACAAAVDQALHELNVTVDGETINIVRPRFEVASPQTTVQLPGENQFGVPAGPMTFTAHAWAAVIRRLRPGRHTVAVQVVAPDWGDPFGSTTFVDVVR